MITQCMNPKCGRELRYLRDGRVVRIVRRDDKRVKLEHFWLCGSCHLDYEFCFSGDGVVTLTRRKAVPVSSTPSRGIALVA